MQAKTATDLDERIISHVIEVLVNKRILTIKIPILKENLQGTEKPI